MKTIIKNSKDQIISVAHIREFKITPNSFDDSYELIGYYTNGDELFIDSYPSKEEAEESLTLICGEVFELSHEPRVLTPEPDTSNKLEKIFEGPGVVEEDIPDGVLSEEEDNTGFGTEMSYDEILNEISKEDKDNE